MSSPYEVRLQFYLEGADSALFHDLEGVEFPLRKNDIVYLNDVGYKVKRVDLHLYDNQYTNPFSNVSEWAMREELYKVYVDEL